jgi:hypothetical protein
MTEADPQFNWNELNDIDFTPLEKDRSPSYEWIKTPAGVKKNLQMELIVHGYQHLLVEDHTLKCEGIAERELRYLYIVVYHAGLRMPPRYSLENNGSFAKFFALSVETDVEEKFPSIIAVRPRNYDKHLFTEGMSKLVSIANEDLSSVMLTPLPNFPLAT